MSFPALIALVSVQCMGVGFCAAGGLFASRKVGWIVAMVAWMALALMTLTIAMGVDANEGT